MKKNKKWNLLFIGDEASKFDLESELFQTHFNKVDKVFGREDALALFKNNVYDMVIGDLTIRPEELAFLKQIKDIKFEQTIFSLVDPKDTDKLYGIADLGVHAFELLPSQFEQALETIASFNPYSSTLNN